MTDSVALTSSLSLCLCGHDRDLHNHQRWAGSPCLSRACGCQLFRPWPADPVPPASPRCICPRFGDTGGCRIADLCCPVHGTSGTDPGDGYWEDSSDDEAVP